MDKFTFESDEHGTFTADAERVTELVNFWNFRCGSTPLDFALIQEDVVAWLGYHSFDELSDVGNRFAFAIMMVNNECDEAYMLAKKEELASLNRPFNSN
jgi:hypothetical protein